MPDEDPKLTDEHKKKIDQWLEDKWKNRKCDCCGEGAWTVEDHLGAVPVFSVGGFGPPYAYVYVIVICDNCGNTRFVNSVPVGIVDEVGGETDA